MASPLNKSWLRPCWPWLFFILHNSTAFYHGSYLLDLTLHFSTVAPLYSTWLYITLLYSTWLYITLLYSTWLYITLLYSTWLYRTHARTHAMLEFVFVSVPIDACCIQTLTWSNCGWSSHRTWKVWRESHHCDTVGHSSNSIVYSNVCCRCINIHATTVIGTTVVYAIPSQVGCERSTRLWSFQNLPVVIQQWGQWGGQQLYRGRQCM